MTPLDRIENICERVGLPILAVIFMMAAVICSGQTMTIAHADQGCAGSCVDAPRLGDFTGPGSDLFGFDQDRGRTTFTFYWNGPQSAVVQIGHVVQGQWVPYVVDVGINNALHQQQELAFLVGGKQGIVSMTTRDMKPGDHIEARAWWSGKFYLSLSRQEYYPLAGANWGDLTTSKL